MAISIAIGSTRPCFRRSADLDERQGQDEEQQHEAERGGEAGLVVELEHRLVDVPDDGGAGICGPPSVRMLTESKSWKFQIVAITTAKKKVGRIKRQA